MKRLALLATLGSLIFTAPAAASIADWGENIHWELGAGYRNVFDATPVSGPELPETTELVSGDGFTLALQADGCIKAWGGDVYGQLGNGTHESAAVVPVPVRGLCNVVQVAAWGAHAMALLTNGTVAVWGANLYGELGNGTSTHGKEEPGDNSDLPLIVANLTGVVRIGTSGASDFAQLADGSLVAWGENKTGQLGDGTKIEKDVPTPVRVVGSVLQFAPGGFSNQGGHVLALLPNGQLVAWGANGQGQLGNSTTTNNLSAVTVPLTGVVSLSASTSHSLALLNTGAVEAWGSNEHGELGVPTTQTCTRALTPCSTTPVPVVGVSKATQIAASFGFSLALSQGSVETWGWNLYGQLGDGTRVDSPLPSLVEGLGEVVAIAAGGRSSFANLAGQAPPPVIEITAGSHTLTVAWRSTETTERFTVEWRPSTHPPSRWTKALGLSPTTRRFTVTGLTAGQPYEVEVKNASFGAHIVSGVPTL